MSTLGDDAERLADIGDQVLAGTPIEEFELGECEILFVLGYTRAGVNGALGPVEESSRV